MSHPHTEQWVDDTWKELEGAIRKVGMRNPGAGFGERFQIRLTRLRRKEEQRKGLIVAGFWLLLATGLLLVLLWALAPLFPSPLALLMKAIAMVSAIVRGITALAAILGSILRFLPDILPDSLLYSILAGMTALGAWGYSALRDFAYMRGVRL